MPGKAVKTVLNVVGVQIIHKAHKKRNLLEGKEKRKRTQRVRQLYRTISDL